MCGIAGVLYADPLRLPDSAVLRAMGDTIAHRGPDGDGYLADPGVGLVHRRLSIIDLAGGAQPIANEDDSVQVVFNGEIYNYPALRGRLLSRGHRLRTRSDTEAIVHLYEEYGDQVVNHLRGMFAFAIWDRPRRRLLLARDRVGIKPLYVYRDSEKLLFGSELKAILAHGRIDRAIDVCAMEDYLAFGFVAGPRSIFQKIQKLQPAHTLSVTLDSWEAAPKRYWRLRLEADHTRTEGYWVEAVRDKVRESVGAHLLADVPVGAFLSGGVDSSLVVACAAGKAEGPLQTFSMGFDEAGFSELPFARVVAERHGTLHREEVVVPDAVSLLDQLASHYDEPFADSSALPTFMVSRLAAAHVKVVLSGDGGDEAFGGYPRYWLDAGEARVREGLPVALRRGVLGPLARIWPKADWLPRPLRAKTRLTNLSLDAGPAYANSLSLTRQPLRRRLLSRDVLAALDGHDPTGRVAEGVANGPAGDPFAAMIAADVDVRLPDDYLTKVDRASMAWGLEVRPPLLDHELLELAARIPSSLKFRGGAGKWVLKEAFRDTLPPSATDRPKQGFEIPVDAWLRGPLREAFEAGVLAQSSPLAPWIDQREAARAYRAHLRGTSRLGATMWSLLVLGRWAERWG
jgi:asparagine synthase (glutamine-hydrolysing)